jgi:hypothetical protein
MDSSGQNTCEFMGAIMAVVQLLRYQMHVKSFLLRGDSMSALSWAEKKRYRGNLVIPAAFLVKYICITYQMYCSSHQHLSKDMNQACDDLSREFIGGVKALRKRSVEDNKPPVTDTEKRYMHDHC